MRRNHHNAFTTSTTPGTGRLASMDIPCSERVLPVRTGLYMKGWRASREVRSSTSMFGKWLRKRFRFPIRVPVYLSPREKIKTRNGQLVSASFFAPDDRTVEPFIRVATGDYGDLKRRFGKDRALASILTSLAHEVIHYQQWVSGRAMREEEAVREAKKLIKNYARAVTHP